MSTSFENLKINYILIYDASGRIAAGQGYDFAARKPIEIPASLKQQLSPGSLLLRHDSVSVSKSGLLVLDDGILLVASSPVVTSERKGPIRGSLIMARRLDAAMVDMLSRTTALKLDIFRADSPSLPRDAETARRELTHGSEAFVRPLSEEAIAGFTFLKDINGRPSLLLRVETGREVYLQRKSTIRTFSLYMMIFLAAAGALAYFLAESWLFRRLTRVSRSIRKLGTYRDFTTRISVSVNDEMTCLVNSVNALLDALEQSQKELRLSERRLQELLENESKLRQERESDISTRAEYTRALVHELKTPLTAMIASAELLAEEERREPLAGMARNVHRASLNLNARIDELMDLARGEVGLLQMNLKAAGPARLLQEVVADMKALADSKEQALVIELPPSFPAFMADATRFKQIVTNIIGNAFKYTPHGSRITIRAREDAGALLTEIEDNGPGIAPEDIPLVFQPYRRIRKDEKGYPSGLGIGLSLSKKLVELHHGRIWVKSQPGKGSTFSFLIPLAEKS